MSWVFIRSEPSLYTVGHYAPDGEWHPEGDYNLDDARKQCHYLNGGASNNTTQVYHAGDM